MKDVVAIDIETTGLSTTLHEITQIALVRGQLEDFLRGEVGQIKNHMIMPTYECEFSEFAVKITGFTRKKWEERGARPLTDVSQQLIEDLAGAIPLGWNPAFDKGFIEQGLHQLCHIHPSEIRWDYHLIDVSNFALPLLMRGEVESLSMSKVGPYLGVSNEGEHDAVIDVKRTLEILPKLWPGGISNL